MGTVFTTVGERKVADLWDGSTTAPAGFWIGWGTSTQASAKGDGDLVAAAAEARVTATLSQPTTNVNRSVGTITAASSKEIGEAGLFASSSAGTAMFVRGDFTKVALAANDSIQFTFDITWS